MFSVIDLAEACIGKHCNSIITGKTIGSAVYIIFNPFFVPSPDNFGNISYTRAFRGKYLKEKCWSESNHRLSFKNSMNLCLIQSYFPNHYRSRPHLWQRSPDMKGLMHTYDSSNQNLLHGSDQVTWHGTCVGNMDITRWVHCRLVKETIPFTPTLILLCV